MLLPLTLLLLLLLLVVALYYNCRLEKADSFLYIGILTVRPEVEAAPVRCCSTHAVSLSHSQCWCQRRQWRR